MWTEPKTDWKETDYINYSDYNRIKNNIAYIKDLAFSLYPEFPFQDMGSDKTNYSQYPYADEFNKLENNLKTLKDKTYLFTNDKTKEWFANTWTPTYEDLNRLERMCLAFYNGLQSQATMKRTLAFRLGIYKDRL